MSTVYKVWICVEEINESEDHYQDIDSIFYQEYETEAEARAAAAALELSDAELRQN